MFRKSFLLLAFIMLLVFNFNVRAAEVVKNYSKWEILKEVEGLVKDRYVEPAPEEDKMVEGAIRGLLETLNDPFTRYIPKDAYKEMKSNLSGKFYGIGIVITQDDDKYIKIISPIFGTPATKVGLLAGDKIIKVNGEDVRKYNLHQIVKKLRGPKGSTVELTIFRKGKGTFKVVVTRDEVKIKHVGWKKIGDDIGYIMITQFTQDVPYDVEKALNEFEAEGVKGIILDLRNNPGGLLTAAIEVARKFIPRGVIVYTKDRFGHKTSYSSFYKTHPLLPMVVLVNGGSASASEILSGALKDHKRAILIGEKTFGKGCVQTVFNLSDGSALALTTAWYYTPSGVCIHKKGIEPNIKVTLPDVVYSSEEVYKDLMREWEYVLGAYATAVEKQKEYEKQHKNEVKDLPAPWISKWDTQLLEAVRVVRAMILMAQTDYKFEVKK